MVSKEPIITWSMTYSNNIKTELFQMKRGITSNLPCCAKTTTVFFIFCYYL